MQRQSFDVFEMRSTDRSVVVVCNYFMLYSVEVRERYYQTITGIWYAWRNKLA